MYKWLPLWSCLFINCGHVCLFILLLWNVFKWVLYCFLDPEAIFKGIPLLSRYAIFGPTVHTGAGGICSMTWFVSRGNLICMVSLP